MNHDEFARMKREIQDERDRYDRLLRMLAENEALRRPPTMLAEKESYELGRIHGAGKERDAIIEKCNAILSADGVYQASVQLMQLMTWIRARSKP
jgi:hypothetical protein